MTEEKENSEPTVWGSVPVSKLRDYMNDAAGFFNPRPFDAKKFYGSDSDVIQLPQEKVYPTADPEITSMEMKDVPMFVTHKLEEALQYRSQSAFAKTFDHWLSTLDALELADKATISSLKKLRGELTGDYRDDRATLDKTKEVLSRLRPTKRLPMEKQETIHKGEK